MHKWEIVIYFLSSAVFCLAAKDLIKVWTDCSRRRARRARMEATKNGD